MFAMCGAATPASYSDAPTGEAPGKQGRSTGHRQPDHHCPRRRAIQLHLSVRNSLAVLSWCEPNDKVAGIIPLWTILAHGQKTTNYRFCLLYTSDAADERS